MSKTNSGYNYTSRSMNGITSFDDGAGTLIENGQIISNGVVVNGNVEANNLITESSSPILTGLWIFANNPPRALNPPVLSDDLVRKDYVDNSVAGFMNLTTDQTVITGIKTFNFSPLVPVPTLSTQATNKLFTDSEYVSLKNVNQVIDGFKEFANIPNLTQYAAVADDMTNKGYCDSAYVSLVTSPQTIAGTKNFTSELGVITPTLNSSATTKLYVDTAISGLPAYMDLTSNQTVISGIKTFDVLPQSVVVPLVNDDLTNKLYVDNAVSGGGLMDLTTNQTVTSGIKTFDVLPQSVVVPLVNDDITNKLYVDNAVAGGVGTNFVDLTTDQTITSGIKTFDVCPETPILASTNDQIANKVFCDSTYVPIFGSMSITGTKTFINQPEVPYPIDPQQAANKTYVDGAITASNPLIKSNVYSDPSPYTGAIGLNTRNDLLRVDWSWAGGDVNFQNCVISIKYNLSTTCAPSFNYYTDVRFNDVGHINIHPYMLFYYPGDYNLDNTTQGGSYSSNLGTANFGLAYLGRSYYDYGQTFIGNIFCNIYVEFIQGNNYVTFFTYNQNNSTLVAFGTPYQLNQAVNLNASVDNDGLYNGNQFQTGSVSLTRLDVQTKPYP